MTPTILPSDSSVVAVAAFKVAHSLRVHHFLVSPQLHIVAKGGAAEAARELQIHAASQQMLGQVAFLAEGAVAALVSAFVSIFRVCVGQDVSFENLFARRAEITMRTRQHVISDGDLVNAEEMMAEPVNVVGEERTVRLLAVVPIRDSVVPAHVVL